ncbi:MAG: family 1 glycosylhydrolase [Bacteroidetes bacterium]|nr:family 1 glycosylhydrolase [Bacteroidota bacterium]
MKTYRGESLGNSTKPQGVQPSAEISALKFPNDFLWGTSTAATQVDGHILNEWTDFIALDGNNCRRACDYFHRYREDIALMQSLGVKAYRMSVEWSRLQSQPYASLNKTEIERLRDLLDCLREADITPMVVLHHFSNPLWIYHNGGWTNPATVPALLIGICFLDY